jgi:CPA2 family monovalent cation:H+ antiporter-2
MHVDPLIPPLVGIVVTILALGLMLQLFRQPQLVGYILAGVIIGPGGIGLLTDPATIEHLGAIGVTLLLFFKCLVTIGARASTLALCWHKLVNSVLFLFPLVFRLL